jgi:hypothetical protein
MAIENYLSKLLHFKSITSNFPGEKIIFFTESVHFSAKFSAHWTLHQPSTYTLGENHKKVQTKYSVCSEVERRLSLHLAHQ